MSKKNPLAKWVLPTEIDPTGSRCISIRVPDDPQHVAAFWGALEALGSAYKWADDVEHKAKDVAQVWRRVVDEALLAERNCHCNSFYMIPDEVYCVADPDLRRIIQITLCDGCPDVEPVVFSGSYFDPEALVARIGYSFALIADDTPCGVQVCSVAGIGLASFGDTFDWVLQWRDCLDNDHEELLNDSAVFYFEDFEAKKLCLSCNVRFAAVVSTSGPVKCVEA